MGDDPPYLSVGTEVSAKYKGAFCEAKIRKVVRVVKCRVTFKQGFGTATITDDQIKGPLKVGGLVEAKHSDKNQYVQATLNRIQDCSQYTVVFDDGDITTLKRTALCLKSGRHFNASETLDQLPLTHPEHFSNPVVARRSGNIGKRKKHDGDDSTDDESSSCSSPSRKVRKKNDYDNDIGKVVIVDTNDKKKTKDNWFPALIVTPAAQEAVKIKAKDDYLVRSFRDGRYYTVPKKETREFKNKDKDIKEPSSNILKSAIEKAMQYLTKKELPTHWDKEILFRNIEIESNSEGQVSEQEVEEDKDEKENFITQLYKFMDEKGSSITKIPNVSNKELDFYLLYKTVSGKGGYTKATSLGLWKEIAMKMGYGNMPATTVMQALKQSYKKYLHNFEENITKHGLKQKSPPPIPILSPPQMTTPTKGRRKGFGKKKGEDSSPEKSDLEDKKKGSTAESPKKELDFKKAAKEKQQDDVKPGAKEQTTPTTTPTTAKKPRGGKQKKLELDDTPPPPIIRPVAPLTPAAERQLLKQQQMQENLKAKSKRIAAVKEKNKTEESAVEKEKEIPAPIINVEVPLAPEKLSPTPTPTKAKPGRKPSNKKKVDADTPPVIEEMVPLQKPQQPEVKVKNDEKSTSTSLPTLPPPSTGEEPEMDIQIGDKLLVYYPKAEGKVTYEAKVIDSVEKTKTFLVHYNGWNVRYDEWIKRDRVSAHLGKTDQTIPEPVVKATAATIVKTTPKVRGRPPNSQSSSSASGSSAKGSMSKGPVVSVGKRTRLNSDDSKHKSIIGSESGSESDDQESSAESEAKSLSSQQSRSSKASLKKKAIRLIKERQEREQQQKQQKQQQRPVTPSTSTTTSIKDEQTSSIKTAAADSSSSTGSNKKETLSNKEESTTIEQQQKDKLIDLNQIRSEMKGIDKIVKNVAAPTPPPSSRQMKASASASAGEKMDIYEFEEDLSEAPKLNKSFGPRSPDIVAKSEEISSTLSTPVPVGAAKSSPTPTSTTVISNEAVKPTISSTPQTTTLPVTVTSTPAIIIQPSSSTSAGVITSAGAQKNATPNKGNQRAAPQKLSAAAKRKELKEMTAAAAAAAKNSINSSPLILQSQPVLTPTGIQQSVIQGGSISIGKPQGIRPTKGVIKQQPPPVIPPASIGITQNIRLGMSMKLSSQSQEYSAKTAEPVTSKVSVQTPVVNIPFYIGPQVGTTTAAGVPGRLGPKVNTYSPQQQPATTTLKPSIDLQSTTIPPKYLPPASSSQDFSPQLNFQTNIYKQSVIDEKGMISAQLPKIIPPQIVKLDTQKPHTSSNKKKKETGSSTIQKGVKETVHAERKIIIEKTLTPTVTSAATTSGQDKVPATQNAPSNFIEKVQSALAPFVLKETAHQTPTPKRKLKKGNKVISKKFIDSDTDSSSECDQNQTKSLECNETIPPLPNEKDYSSTGSKGFKLSENVDRLPTSQELIQHWKKGINKDKESDKKLISPSTSSSSSNDPKTSYLKETLVSTEPKTYQKNAASTGEPQKLDFIGIGDSQGSKKVSSSVLSSTYSGSDSSKDVVMREEENKKKQEALKRIKEEEESCNSLLCEEIIPGSPTPAAEYDPDNNLDTMSNSTQSTTKDTFKSFKKDKNYYNSEPKHPSHKNLKMSPPSTPESGNSSRSGKGSGENNRNHSPEIESLKSKESSDGDTEDASNSSEAGGNKSSQDLNFESSAPQKKRSMKDDYVQSAASPKRRRIQRKISPEERGVKSYRGRGTGRSPRALHHHPSEEPVEKHHPQPPKPIFINVVKPEKNFKYNFIPDLDNLEPEERIALLQKGLSDLREKYSSLKSELTSVEKRRKRCRKREREKAKAAAAAKLEMIK